jgi:hypothetical protein
MGWRFRGETGELKMRDISLYLTKPLLDTSSPPDRITIRIICKEGREISITTRP